MTARFIGARSLGDRRRRRLAHDGEQRSVPVTATSRRSPSRASANVENSASPPVELESLIRKGPQDSMIPYAPWKLWGIGLAGLTLWALMLWCGLNANGTAFEDVLALRHQRLSGFFSTVCLLAATQLSALILWHRIRSKKDFSGRYRIWTLSLLFWGLACCAETMQWHTVWSAWAQQRWPVSFWPGAAAYWIAPTVVGFLALHRLIQLEMRGSRASRLVWDTTWWIAGTALLVFLTPNLFAGVGEAQSVSIGVTTLWHLSSVIALLVHARHVVHVSNEAAPRKSPRMIRAWHAAHVTAVKLAKSAERLATAVPRPKFLARFQQSEQSPDDANAPKRSKRKEKVQEQPVPPVMRSEIPKPVATKAPPPQNTPVSAAAAGTAPLTSGSAEAPKSTGGLWGMFRRSQPAAVGDEKSTETATSTPKAAPKPAPTPAPVKAGTPAPAKAATPAPPEQPPQPAAQSPKGGLWGFFKKSAAAQDATEKPAAAESKSPEKPAPKPVPVKEKPAQPTPPPAAESPQSSSAAAPAKSWTSGVMGLFQRSKGTPEQSTKEEGKEASAKPAPVVTKPTPSSGPVRPASAPPQPAASSPPAKPADNVRPTPAKPAAAPVVPPPATSKVRIDPPQPAVPPVSAKPAPPPVSQSYEEDDGDDEEEEDGGDYSGMSRKERKKLKKLKNRRQ